MTSRFRKFEFEGLQIESQVIDEKPVDGGGRAFIIQSRCGHQERTNSNTCMLPPSDVEQGLAAAQESFAKQFAKELRGIHLPHFTFVGLRFRSFETGKWSAVMSAAVDPDIEMTLVRPELAEVGFLAATGKYHDVKDRAGNIFRGEVFTATIQYADLEFQQDVCALNLGDGPMCIAGQDVVAYMRNLGATAYYRFVEHDITRIYRDALRNRGKSILLIGAFDEAGRARLNALQQLLFERGFRGILLDDFPDASEQSLFQKMMFLASLCKFVVCLDESPAGHYQELEVCSQFNLVTAVISGRADGSLSTAMLYDLTLKNRYAKVFAGEVAGVLDDILTWAEETTKAKTRDYDSIYWWRSGSSGSEKAT